MRSDSFIFNNHAAYPLSLLKVLFRGRLDQSMEEALDLKVQFVNVIGFTIDELLKVNIPLL